MRDLHVFVHYSRWDAISNSVLEAMALGLPVVVSDIPGNRGLIENLTARINQVFENNADVYEVGEARKLFAGTFERRS